MTLLTRDLKRNLFKLFATWGGPYAKQFGSTDNSVNVQPSNEEMALQFCALSAMSAVLCCGSCFDPHYMAEDGIIYPWLDMLLTSIHLNVSKILITNINIFVFRKFWIKNTCSYQQFKVFTRIYY